MSNEYGLITGKEIRNTVYNKEKYLIEDLLRGNKVSILTGGSKTGKSTIALQMAYAISTGQPFLDKKTKKKDVLYICLDNDEDLIAERLKMMNLNMDEHVIFSFNKLITLGNELPADGKIPLSEVINKTFLDHPELGLVIIDLFDNIRSLTIKTEANNVKDAQDMDFIKEIANVMEVHTLLLNHDTKSGILNGYCSSKGGVKLVGSCNGSYLHLIRNGIGETNATLEVGGRNIREDKLALILDTETLTYSLSQDRVNDEMPYEIGIIRNFIIKNNGYEGTISNLLQLTKLTIAANRCSRLLNNHKELLKEEGILFSVNPGHSNGRIYKFIVFEDDKDDESNI